MTNPMSLRPRRLLRAELSYPTPTIQTASSANGKTGRNTEHFGGSRNVEVYAVEFLADGTGSFRMNVGDELSFINEEEPSLTTLYAHDLRWEKKELGKYVICDDETGLLFELSISD